MQWFVLSRCRAACVSEPGHKAIRRHSQNCPSEASPKQKSTLGLAAQNTALSPAGTAHALALPCAPKQSGTAEEATTTFVLQIQELQASSEALFASGAKARFARVPLPESPGQTAQGSATSAQRRAVCANPEPPQQFQQPSILVSALWHRASRIWPPGHPFRNF